MISLWMRDEWPTRSVRQLHVDAQHSRQRIVPIPNSSYSCELLQHLLYLLGRFDDVQADAFIQIAIGGLLGHVTVAIVPLGTNCEAKAISFRPFDVAAAP